MNGKKVQVVLREDMITAMKSLAAKQGSPVSLLHRTALSYWLKNVYGVEIPPDLQWGGKREAGNKKDGN